jgi:Mg2+ and Co2+ transporter CorA
MTDSQPDLSSRLKHLTSELESLEAELRSTQDPDVRLLQDFRRSVDEVRNTAWTVGELINARASRKNPKVVLSFLAAERMRRFSQMVRSLAEDMDDPVVTWETSGVQKGSESLDFLQARLRELLEEHRARIKPVRDAGD